MRSRRIFSAIAGISLVLIAAPASSAAAGEKADLDSERKPKLEKEISTDETTVTESEIGLSLVGTVGTFTAEAKHVAAWGTNNYWLKSASTARIGGPTTGYNTHVHAAMNEYNTKSQWQSDPSNVDYQWSNAKDSRDATSTVGPSNQRLKATEFFWNASGHQFTNRSSGWSWSPTIDSYYSCTSTACTAN